MKWDFLGLLPLLLTLSYKEALLNSQGRSSEKEQSHSAIGGLPIDWQTTSAPSVFSFLLLPCLLSLFLFHVLCPSGSNKSPLC